MTNWEHIWNEKGPYTLCDRCGIAYKIAVKLQIACWDEDAETGRK